MAIGSILIGLRRRAWIPVLCAALTTVVVGVLLLRAKPTYTATATVIAKNPENATDRPLSFPEVATSNNVALDALRATHIQESVDELERALSVVSGKSDIYQITVKDGDPVRATALANAVAGSATVFYQQLAGGDTVSINAQIDQDRQDLNKRYLDASQALLAFDQAHPQIAAAIAAQAGTGRSTVDPALGAQRLQLQLAQQAASQAVLNFEAGITQGKLQQIITIRSFESHVLDKGAPILVAAGRITKIAFAGVIGLILGLVVAFLLAYFGSAINDPDEAEAYLGAPVVGSIPKANPHALRRAAAEVKG